MERRPSFLESLNFQFTSPKPPGERLQGLGIGLLWGSLGFAPWAFGATEAWSIGALTVAGLLSGLLWWLGSRLAAGEATTAAPRAGHWTATLLAMSTGLFLLYGLVAALNAQSAFDPASQSFRPLPHLDWLPHSYDRRASWLAWWRNLSLAAVFWTTRAWLLSAPRNRAGATLGGHTGLLPQRARRWLSFLVSNGGLLTIVALLQRLDQSPKLLWLVKPTIHQTAETQFGPFAYRSNGLQYLGLLWPLALAGWSMLTHAQQEESLFGSGRRQWLLFCGLLLATSPLLWESRLAVVVGLSALGAAGTILLVSHRVSQRRLVVIAGLVSALGLGLACNWPALRARFAADGLQSAGRVELLQAGWALFRDHWFYGSGPGSFPALYALYRPDNGSPWMAQMHCDWLQSLATYGTAGCALLAAGFVALFLAPLAPGKLPARKSFILLSGLALAGCLAQATLDFPFQILSIQQLFVVVAAFLSVLSAPRPSSDLPTKV